MSIEGNYSIVFVTNGFSSGGGNATLESQKILGGDSCFSYLGDYRCSDGRINGKVRVSRTNQGLPSVFGELEEFELLLEGAVNDNVINLLGAVVGKPELQMHVEMKKISELP